MGTSSASCSAYSAVGLSHTMSSEAEPSADNVQDKLRGQNNVRDMALRALMLFCFFHVFVVFRFKLGAAVPSADNFNDRSCPRVPGSRCNQAGRVGR